MAALLLTERLCKAEPTIATARHGNRAGEDLHAAAPDRRIGKKF